MKVKRYIQGYNYFLVDENELMEDCRETIKAIAPDGTSEETLNKMVDYAYKLATTPKH